MRALMNFMQQVVWTIHILAPSDLRSNHDCLQGVCATLFGMRALMDFMQREVWTIHILAPDCGTVLLTFHRVPDQQTLLRIVSELHGDVAGLNDDIMHLLDLTR